jgi:hypothetical protein
MYRDARHESPYLTAPSQAKLGLLPFPDKLHVVTAISNPFQYLKRFEHYRAFEKMVADAGAILYTVEVQQGDRPFEVTDPDNPRHLQLRSRHTLWVKECALNLGIIRLVPASAQYIAWVDADLSFSRPDWAQATLQALQMYEFVQMYSELIGLGPTSEPLNRGLSFMEGWRRGIPFVTDDKTVRDETFYRRKEAPVSMQRNEYGEASMRAPGWAGSPGGAWAARRVALDAVGGLIDFAILGSADWHQACGLMGFMELSLKGGYDAEYVRWLCDWQDRAVTRIRRNVGHIYGTLLHHYHGANDARNYGNRWRILTKHKFNPRTDIYRDMQGLWQLTETKWQLRDDIRAYFSMRSEDSVDLPKEKP